MISKEQFRAFIATPKGKLAVAGAALVLCWIILLAVFFGDYITAFGDPKSLDKARKELDNQKAEYDKIRVEYDEVVAEKKRYREISASAWSGDREDQVKNKLHNSVTAAAAKLEFKLSRISQVKIEKVNNDLYYAKIDIAADGKLDEIVNLLMALEDIHPVPNNGRTVLKWDQLVLRPDNRPRPQTASGIDSVNLANQLTTVERTRVMTSGTLRVICTDKAPAGESERNSGK